jgi:hypothetical protein
MDPGMKKLDAFEDAAGSEKKAVERVRAGGALHP